MNIIRVAGMELAANANLFACVDLALDLSENREDEVEVLADGVKIRAFKGGRSTYPPRRLDTLAGCLNLIDLEQAAIEQAVAQTRGDIRQAAKVLGVGRTTLYRKLKRRETNVLAFQRAA